jgi:integrase
MVALSQFALDALRVHRQRQLEEGVQFPGEWEMPELGFTNYAGGLLDPGNASTCFKRALKRAGLPALRIHDMRHTTATLLLQAGENAKVVSEMLGHSTIVITLDIYLHTNPVMHERAADTMDAILGSAT